MSKKRASRNKKVFKAAMQRRKFRRGSLNRFGPKRKNIQEIDNLNTIQQKDEEDANKRQGWWNQ